MTTQSMRDLTQQSNCTCNAPSCSVSDSFILPACSSFCAGSGLVTTDLDAGISYISSQVAINDRVYQLVKHACLRSLSCEVSAKAVPFRSNSTPRAATSTTTTTKSQKIPLPTSSKSLTINRSAINNTTTTNTFDTGLMESDNDDGVILFGDDDHGYTLSHTFRLRDAKARGFQRWFSLIVICMDKLLITNNYEFFVSSLSAIIHQLQERADDVFVMEQSELGDLANECIKQASRASLLPAHFMRNRVTKLDLDTSRSLALITANPNIFTKLHKQMTYVLRTQARLCTESVLEGVPTQDALVQFELERSFDYGAAAIGDGGEVLNLNDDQMAVDNVNCYCSFTNSNSTPINDYGIDPLEQVDYLQSISQKIHALGKHFPNALDIILKQLVTGGQLVVQCDDRCLARQVLTAFAYLLPIGCVHITYSESYEHVFRYNLLGCPMSLEIPNDVSDQIVVLCVDIDESVELSAVSSKSFAFDSFDDVHSSLPHSSASFIENTMNYSDELMNNIPPYETSAISSLPLSDRPSINNNNNNNNNNKSSSAIAQKNFYRCRILQLSAPSTLLPNEATPTIVQRYKQLLLDNELGNRVLEAVLKNTREQWLSKSKLIYELSRQKEGIDLTKDASVLRFWQAGLSRTYKQHVLNTINSYQQFCV
ncbi:unnamed protein product [Anisakis simplex]|uniref:Folliculin n=1 Tax=Anisakis simplex TaxID=6269 RepID=A0A0M3JT48_ANISI|nr:unnamed protein product [Anisakis simplex]